MTHAEMAVRSLASRRRGQVQAAPVRALVEGRGIPRGVLVRRLAARTGGNVGTWRRWLTRLERADYVSVWHADAMCVALGVHLSRVDPAYWEAEKSA